MTQAKVRNRVVVLIIIPLLLFLIPFEMYDWFDSALLLYVITWSFVSFCLAFWTWWGIKSRKKPTDVFTMVGMLMASIWLVLGMNIYARAMFVMDPLYYSQWISNANIWAYRVLPELFVFVWLFAWIIGRLLGEVPVVPSTPEHRPKVLIVEDERSISEIMKESLSQVCAFQIDQAFTMEEAEQLFVPGKYSFITMDLNLGCSTDDGCMLAYNFRRQDPLVFISIVSGHTGKMDDKDLMEVVDDFIIKPFEIDYLQLKSLLWVLRYRRRLRNRDDDGLSLK